MPLKRSLHPILVFSLTLLFSVNVTASEFKFEEDIIAFEQTINSFEQGTAYVNSLSTRRTGSRSGVNTDGDEVEVVEVEIVLFGHSLRLELRPVDIFAPGAKVVRVTDHGIFEEPATANTYRGVVLGVSDSVVAVSIEAGIPEGLILFDNEVYLIRSALNNDATAGPGKLQALRGPAALGLTDSPQALPLNVLEIAAVADFEYFQLHGVNASAQIASVINQVDAIYQSEIETSTQILTTMVFETSLDPFSDFNSGNLFSDFRNTTTEFGNWRAAQGGSLSAAGLGHLFSNKFNINAGFGFINVLCEASRGVSISTTNFVSLHPLLIEHELGHNFGAGHDGEAGSSCESAPPGFIMAPAATGTEFSVCSKTIIRANRDRAACISQQDGTIFADGFESGAGVR